MANYWRLRTGCTEGTQEWDLWTTIADRATLNSAGQVTDAPDTVRKGDIIYGMTGCSVVTTVAGRAAFTAKGLFMATADAADGALDLADGTVLETDSD